MDNPYAQSNQNRQRNTILTSQSGGGRRGKGSIAADESEYITTFEQEKIHDSLLKKRKRIKWIVSCCGPLVFGVMFLLVFAMLLQFDIAFLSEIPENDNALYKLGQKLAGLVISSDRSWVIGFIICILFLYAVPYIICAVFGLISNLFPTSEYNPPNAEIRKGLIGYNNTFELGELKRANNRLLFWSFTNPAEWIITILTLVIAVWGYVWICADAGVAVTVGGVLLTALCILPVFSILYLPSRFINYSLYGRGAKKRQKMYTKTLALWKERDDEYKRDEKRRNLLSQLLRKAQKEGHFDINSLPNISCPDDAKKWIDLGHKYGFYHTHFSGFRLMRMAYSRYEDEYQERKRAEEARKKEAELEVQRKREEEERRRYEQEEARITANIMAQIEMDKYDKGLKTFMTDTRNGEDVYYKDGLYYNESGERVPIQWIWE